MTVVNGFRLVSNSEVQTFKQCRRKWWLQWYRGLASKRIEVQGVRNTGTRLHIALAELYQPHDVIVRPMLALMDSQVEDLRIFDAGLSDSDSREKLLSDFQLEQIMLEGYLEWLEETGADSDLEVISSETYVEAELPGVYGNTEMPPVKVIGKVDTRVRDRRTGLLKFMDHKSVTSFVIPMLHQNQQLLHYELLQSLQPGPDARTDGAFYNMLRRVKRTAKAKPPFYKRIEVTHNQHELDAYKNHLIGVVTEMQTVEAALNEDPEAAGMLAYPTPHRDCSWKCPFVKECRMFDDGSRVEAALEQFYTTVNPLDYYQGKEVEE